MIDYDIISNDKIIKALYIIYNELDENIKEKLINSYFNEIIKNLNFITNNNIDVYIKIILNYIRLILYFSNNSENYLNKIYNLLSLNNNENDKLYIIIIYLNNNYNIFKNILENDFSDYKNDINTININDECSVYLDLCNQNNNIDNILNKSKFYINLLNNNIIDYKIIYSLIEYIFKIIYENILIDNKKDKIYLLYNINYNLIYGYYYYIKKNNINDTNINNIINNVKNLIDNNNKLYKSINNKAIFKFLDLIDELNI